MVTENRDSMLTENGHASRLALGRLIAGDVDAEARAGLEAHARSCPRCGSALAKARDAAAAFQAKHPTLESLASGRGRAIDFPEERARTGWLERLAALFGGSGLRPALAGFGVLALVAVFWTFQGKDPGGDLAAKGGTHFYLTVNGRQISGQDLDCGPSDTLQLGIAGKPVYYAILYRDDEKELSHYMGGEGETQKPLGTPVGENLPHSLILSGGWGTETIYCIFADRPFTVDQAKDFVNNSAAAPVEGMRAQVFRLRNIRT